MLFWHPRIFPEPAGLQLLWLKQDIDEGPIVICQSTCLWYSMLVGWSVKSRLWTCSISVGEVLLTKRKRRLTDLQNRHISIFEAYHISYSLHVTVHFLVIIQDQEPHAKI